MITSWLVCLFLSVSLASTTMSVLQLSRQRRGLLEIVHHLSQQKHLESAAQHRQRGAANDDCDHDSDC